MGKEAWECLPCPCAEPPDGPVVVVVVVVGRQASHALLRNKAGGWAGTPPTSPQGLQLQPWIPFSSSLELTPSVCYFYPPRAFRSPWLRLQTADSRRDDVI